MTKGIKIAGALYILFLCRLPLTDRFSLYPFREATLSNLLGFSIGNTKGAGPLRAKYNASL